MLWSAPCAPPVSVPAPLPPGEFLKSWHFELPDCLLLDTQMPGVSGTEVQKALNVAGARFPVIIVTGSDEPSFRAQSMLLGAAAYLCKPFDDVALLQALTSAVAPSAA